MYLFKILIMIILSSSFSYAAFVQNGIKDSIVKIYAVSKIPNYMEPWNVSIVRASGSGSIIKDNLILTNAHVVANNTFIEVRRYGERKRYQATVLSVSHQADLALLRVEDKDFFKGAKALEFGVLPKIQQKITVYGFPTGGDTLSVTTGVVSRIEHIRYVHSGERFLGIQVDAAINPGNSGGPALSDGKIVGVVMQQRRHSQNIGYLVPVNMVMHFLTDIKDGKYDGYPDIGILTQSMENPALKKMHQLDENVTGELIISKLYNCIAGESIKKGDVLAAIDGHKIENDGTVEFRHHEFTSYKYFLDMHQMGESVILDILRDKKIIKVPIKLLHKSNDFLLVKTLQYDKRPSYFIFGGYVFAPLTSNLLSSVRGSVLELRALTRQWPSEKKKGAVVLVRVLATEYNRGDHGLRLWPVVSINGETFKDFADFYQKLIQSKGEFIRLEDREGSQIAISVKDAKRAKDMILQRYQIKSDRSIDLIR